ncbi:beta-lactamase family protein [Bacillus sp. F19]|nr:beta-lactamase family protein [Bacillus sp. F19]
MKNLKKRISDYMNHYAKSFPISGNVLVAIEGRIIFEECYGFSNLEHQVLNAPTTKFRIASITKQFTAALIMILNEKGLLKVEDKLAAFFPEYPEFSNEITIHHLLTHTSGIPDYYDCVSTFFDREDKLYLTPDQFISLFKNETLDFEPGSDWKYSNSGYLLLGLIIERVTSKKFEEALNDYILTPLDMHSTGCDHQNSILANRAAGYIRPEQVMENAPYVEMSKYFSDGGMYSTVRDLLKWDQALYSESVLSNETLDKIFSPNRNNYGYGWFVETQFERRRVLHAGKISGFVSLIDRYLDDKVSIFMLGNYDFINWYTISYGIAAIIFGHPHPSPLKEPYPISSKLLDSYLGVYESTDGRRLTVTEEQKKIYFKWGDDSKFEIYPISDVSFRRLCDDVDEVHTFRKEGNRIKIWEYEKLR